MRYRFVRAERHALGVRTWSRLRPWSCARNGPRYWVAFWYWWRWRHDDVPAAALETFRP